MASRAELLYQQIMTGDPLANIEAMVAEKRQETEFLDFKNFDSGSGSGNKKTWAQALSGFANTEGGVLVWGIDARKIDVEGFKIDAANEARPFPQPVAFVEVLRNFHREATTEPVVGVDLKAIVKPDGTGFVVCYVPQGQHKPYRDEQAKQYWQRVQDSFVTISHSLLRSLFYPQARARMRLIPEWIDDTAFSLTMENVGNATGTDVFAELILSPASRLAFHAKGFNPRTSVHPKAKYLLESYRIEHDDRHREIEIHLAIYMKDQEPQYIRLLVPEWFRDKRRGSAGFTIQTSEEQYHGKVFLTDFRQQSR